jgi:hypothetical protein
MLPNQTGGKRGGRGDQDLGGVNLAPRYPLELPFQSLYFECILQAGAPGFDKDGEGMGKSS